jgi:ribosomal protein L7/L12
MADREIADLRARLEKLETQMGFLFRRLGISDREAPAGQASAQVIELLRQGDKAGAMKAFMHENGASLKDAKNFIESLPV